MKDFGLQIYFSSDFIIIFSLGIELMLLEKEMLEERFGNIGRKVKAQDKIRQFNGIQNLKEGQLFEIESVEGYLF